MAKSSSHVGASTPLAYVYFIEAEGRGRVKIGKGRDARKRMAQLQIGSADRLSIRGVYLTDDADALELRLHAEFKELRLHGEWFRAEGALADLMATLLPLEMVDQGQVKVAQHMKPVEDGVWIIRRPKESRRSLVDRVMAARAAMA
jgi:hypothetical protein